MREKEVCPPTGLSLNGRLFISNKDHLDALVCVYYISYFFYLLLLMSLLIVEFIV